jgi:hypothetical protein
MRVKVIGFKRFEGNLDGKDISSGKLFAEVRLDDSRNGDKQFAKGIAVEEIRLPSAELVKRIEHIPPPFFCELETERVSNGRESREVVFDLRPIDVAPPTVVKPAKAAA